MKNTLFIFRWSGAAEPERDASSFLQRGKRRQSTPTPFIISFIDFLLFCVGGGGCCGRTQLHCARNQFFVVFQNKLGAA